MDGPESPAEALPVHPVWDATRRRLEALGEAHSPLGQVALTLAITLDAGAGLSTAAVARELRATLKELTPRDGGDAFQRLMDELSSEVRHPSSS